jgi:RTX calcium-binding nonapeptide repeat (4 copies)
MRRLMIMVALVVLLVGVFAATAYARTFTCTDLPCYGTPDRDDINERPAFGVPDEIFGRAGLDIINATISPGDVDILHGNKGNDRLKTREQFPESDSLDTVYGGEGTDTCRVNDGDEYFGCEVVYVDGVLQP